MGYINKKIFKETCFSDELDSEREEILKKYAEIHMPGVEYLSCKKGYAASRYVLTCDPSMIHGYISAKMNRTLEAVFKTPRTSIMQEGDKLIIEVPNETAQELHLRLGLQHIDDMVKNNDIMAYIGERLDGLPQFLNLTANPHTLIAGMTGSGKSVCIHNILLSLMYQYSPNEIVYYIMDIKNQMGVYKNIRSVKRYGYSLDTILKILYELQEEVNRRNQIIQGKGYPKLSDYNKYEEEKIPEAIVLIEEIDVLFSEAERESREYRRKFQTAVETLVKKARSSGLHIIIVSQRPSAKTSGTEIRSQLNNRICLRVSDGTDSRFVLNRKGAENLMQRGEAYMLENDKLKRLQIANVEYEEWREAIRELEKL